MGQLIMVLVGIFSGIASLFKTVANGIASIVTPMLQWAMEHWLKVILWGIFASIFLNLTSTLIAYTMYHIGAAITISIAPVVHQDTVFIIVNSIYGLFFLFVGIILKNLFGKS